MIGNIVAGKYRIDSLLGAGGMGNVFAAHHELLDVSVAIKLLSPSLLKHPFVVDRFLREARAAARIKSEHVARVMDVGTLENGRPYIAMELLEGEDLRSRLRRVGRMTVPKAADCVIQALEAVAHAHAAGIVHRDLKPENLFIAATDDGREIVKVLDFGIAKVSLGLEAAGAAASPVLTAEHTALGSPHYMAPEQVRGLGRIDHRVDLWALGAILYELVTGREAFPGLSVGEVFASVLHGMVTPLRALRPDVPPELEAVVEGCLAREPDRRFADAAELAWALAPLCSEAWRTYPERIEQTLIRSRRFSDPASGPVSVRRVRAAPPAFGVAGGSNNDTDALTSPVRGASGLQASHAGRQWVFGILDIVLAASLSFYAVGTWRTPMRVEPVTSASPSAGLTTPAPPPTVSVVVSSLPPAPGVPASAAAALPQPSSSGQSPTDPVRRIKPAPARPTATSTGPRASPSTRLPRILGSPD
jgi:serine/threonine-protein kinase